MFLPGLTWITISLPVPLCRWDYRPTESVSSIADTILVNSKVCEPLMCLKMKKVKYFCLSRVHSEYRKRIKNYIKKEMSDKKMTQERQEGLKF
jgi:hypothetical protein